MLATTANTQAGEAVFLSKALLSHYLAGSRYAPSHNRVKYNITPERIRDKFSFNHPTSALSPSQPKVQGCSAPTSQHTGTAAQAQHEPEGTMTLQKLGRRKI